jgi:uncharacterized protein
MSRLEEDLLAQGLELRETHISRVFLAEHRVYKVKKPVELGFLDFRTLEQRRAACDDEVELNRRLAPGVYLGVVPILRGRDGAHRIGSLGGAEREVGAPQARDEGELVEWAVEMVRLPDLDAADRRLRDGRLGRADLERIAAHLAAFHDCARCDDETARFGALDVIEHNVRENFDQMRADAQLYLTREEFAAIERAQLGFLGDQRARFEQRLAARKIRDGHGDLRLEHCYLDDQDGTNIIDCIEFNQRFRYGDVCADVAFLAMDLAVHERSDLSEAFLAAYARHTDDYEAYGLVDFYESYRAFVRGKVNAMLASDASASPAARQRASGEARRYFLLSEAFTREPLERPRLIAVGGLIASGKSAIATQLADRVRGPVLEADLTRKRLAGVEPETPWSDAAFSGRYSAESTAAVYEELLRRAEIVLDSGRPVVLDASFRAREQRAAARTLAQRLGIEFLFVECVAPEAILRERLARRAQGRSVSDGRLDVFEAFARSYEAVNELAAQQHLTVDTSGTLAQSFARIEPRL